jgi:hypothetical protein
LESAAPKNLRGSTDNVAGMPLCWENSGKSGLLLRH